MDMCTGSGCIAVAAASLTDATVVAADISADALKVARGNIDKFNLGDRVELVQARELDIPIVQRGCRLALRVLLGVLLPFIHIGYY